MGQTDFLGLICNHGMSVQKGVLFIFVWKINMDHMGFFLDALASLELVMIVGV